MNSGALPSTMALAIAPAAPNPLAESAAAALTRRMRAGDEAAWTEFHQAYAPRLRRYLLVLCRGQEEIARETQQQTFLRAVRYLRICETEAELWNWLACLARSAARDAQRRERRYGGFLERWLRHQPKPVFAEPEPEAEASLETALTEELAVLPKSDRELLEQKYLSGESVRMLAATLQTSEKAVESRLTRARQKLKTALLSRLRHENRA